MKAIIMSGFGAGASVAEHPTPVPEPGQVLLRVRASSVNGFDAAVAAGWMEGMMEHRFPLVLGKDFAGIVTAVGAGVSRFATGDKVFGVVMQPYLADGGFAEYLAVDAEGTIAAVPDGLALTTAGALGLAGTAALDCITAVAPKPGELVLISGATGGVGAIAIQLAATTGATVIATIASSDEAAFVTGLGATHTVDHTDDLPAQIRDIAPNGVPVALHLAGDGAVIASTLAAGGRMASTLGLTPDKAGRGDVTIASVMANPTPTTLDALAADVITGAVQVPITRTYPLDEVPKALADFRDGTLGKLAITIA